MGYEKRNWGLYNLAQTSEKMLALRILNDAVNHLDIPYNYKGNGRPPIGIDDMIKCRVIISVVIQEMREIWNKFQPENGDSNV